jgi:hypothetical protein
MLCETQKKFISLEAEHVCACRPSGEIATDWKRMDCKLISFFIPLDASHCLGSKRARGDKIY